MINETGPHAAQTPVAKRERSVRRCFRCVRACLLHRSGANLTVNDLGNVRLVSNRTIRGGPLG
jgi:hypothetical protein